MKNFLSILIILLTFTAHSYSKSFEWIKTEKMYTNANQLIHTKEFVDFLKKT